MKKKIYIFGKNSNLSKNLSNYLKNSELMVRIGPASIEKLPLDAVECFFLGSQPLDRSGDPVASEAAIDIASPSVIDTVLPAKSTLPIVRVVESPKVIDFPPEERVASPATLTAPESVMVPDEFTVSAPPTETVPKSIALASVI